MMNEQQKTKNNKPNSNNMIQQTFHKSMFIRQKANSMTSIPATLSGEENACTPDKERDTAEIRETQDDWQKDTILIKRAKRKETSPIHNDPKRKVRNTFNATIPVSNSFEILDSEPPQIQENREKVYVPKPEPIFVTGVLNVSPLKEAMNKFLETNLYTMTTLRSGHIVKIMPKDIQTYKIIRENFIANNIAHYTYQLKNERAYRVVLRGLHATEDTTQIAKELTEMGHEVRQVVNVLHRVTKDPLPMFYVDLEPKHNNKNIFGVKFINNMKVTLEAPYKKKKQEILQCKRCQRLGHTKNQCFRHPTKTCNKKPDTYATCANCLEKHPASYKGCRTYKEYRDKILKTTTKTRDKQQAPEQKSKTENNKHIIKPPISNKKTYAEATKKGSQPASNVDTTNFSHLIETMCEKLQQTMMSMFESMMDKMMNNIVQLVTSLTKK